MAEYIPLNPRQQRQVYLITYSQADILRFPTRQSFSDAVLEAFAPTPATPLRWVCGKEDHQDGNYHYHMAIKLDRTQRWLAVKNRINDNYGIVVNFSGHHSNYFSAWTYATKEDENAIQSANHPDLTDGPPHTANASRTRVENGGQPPKKRARMSTYDVVQVIIQKKIKSRVHLLALCEAQRQEGKTDLVEFVCNRGRKAVEEAISTAWEIVGAQRAIEREQMRRLDIMEEARNSPCVPRCDGRWIEQARDILSRNGIDVDFFGVAVTTLLREGRGKYRNILISGPTNCGKTFLLNPLRAVFKAFSNPATTSYAWIGAETAEVIMLNDFRWTPQVITNILVTLRNPYANSNSKTATY